MYLAVGLVIVMILAGLAPAIRVAWSLLANLGERADESPSSGATRPGTWRAA